MVLGTAGFCGVRSEGFGGAAAGDGIGGTRGLESSPVRGVSRGIRDGAGAVAMAAAHGQLHRESLAVRSRR